MPVKFLSAQDGLALAMAAKYGSEVDARVKTYLTTTTKDEETRGAGLILLRGRVIASDKPEHVDLANQFRGRTERELFPAKKATADASPLPKGEAIAIA